MGEQGCLTSDCYCRGRRQARALRSRSASWTRSRIAETLERTESFRAATRETDLAEAPKSRAIALLLELGVVFLGVFIALAADSWSQSSQEAERALAYMRALQSDVIEAQDRVGTAIGETSAFLEENVAFLDLLRSDTPIGDTTTFAQLSIAPLITPWALLMHYSKQAT